MRTNVNLVAVILINEFEFLAMVRAGALEAIPEHAFTRVFPPLGLCMERASSEMGAVVDKGRNPMKDKRDPNNGCSRRNSRASEGGGYSNVPLPLHDDNRDVLLWGHCNYDSNVIYGERNTLRLCGQCILVFVPYFQHIVRNK